MKVHINPDGTVELDVADGESSTAVEFIDAIQTRHRESAELERSVRETRVAETSNLSAILYRTWEFLVEHDQPEGIHISAVARAFGTNNSAVSSRLKELMKQGNVKRIHRGYYRACTPDQS